MSMDIGSRVVAPFTELRDDRDRNVSIDINSFVMRLLLFDTYTIETIRLKDIAKLINNFGFNGLMELLDSGFIKIHLAARTMGAMNRTDPTRGDQNYPVGYDNVLLPYGSFDLRTIDIADRDWYLNNCYKNLKEFTSKKEARQLKLSVRRQLTEVPKVSKDETVWFRESLLANGSFLNAALALTLKTKNNITIDPFELHLNISSRGEAGYITESNIKEKLQLSDLEAHKAIESTLLMISGFYQRLSMMKNYESIAWFSERDAVLLKEDMKIVVGELDSSLQEKRLTRVLELRGLPQIDENTLIDANKLLMFKTSSECTQFKAWLKSIDSKSDEDVAREIKSFYAAISIVLTSTPTRIAKFILSTGVGGSRIRLQDY